MFGRAHFSKLKGDMVKIRVEIADLLNCYHDVFGRLISKVQTEIPSLEVVSRP